MPHIRPVSCRAAALSVALFAICIGCCNAEQQYSPFQPPGRPSASYPSHRPPTEYDGFQPVRRIRQTQDALATWRRDGMPAGALDDQPFPQDLVRRYVSDNRSKFVVAVSSSIMGYLLGVIVSLTVLSRVAHTLTIAFALAMFGSVYLRGEIAELARALGVALLLFIKRVQVRSAIWGAQRYLRSALKLAHRKPFPPSENPWSYVPDTPDMANFTMTRTLYALAAVGLYFGWSVGRNIPLVPTWLVALGAAISLAYFGTSRTELGDLLRYVGACVVDSVLLFRNINKEVLLTQRAYMLGRRLFTTAAAIDQKYELRQRIGKGVSATVDTLSDAYGKVQADISSAQQEQPEWQPPPYQHQFPGQPQQRPPHQQPYRPGDRLEQQPHKTEGRHAQQMSSFSAAGTGGASTRHKLKELFAQSEALNNTMVEGAAARAKPLGVAPAAAVADDILASDVFMEGLPRISRNVAELEAAAMQLGTGRAAGDRKHVQWADSDTAEQSGFILLAKQGFDAEGLTKDVQSLRFQAQYEPREPLGETDIESYLLHHHDMILLTAIEEAHQSAEADAQKLQRQWEQEDWVHARQQFLDSLGYRRQAWQQPAAERPLPELKHPASDTLASSAFSTAKPSTQARLLAISAQQSQTTSRLDQEQQQVALVVRKMNQCAWKKAAGAPIQEMLAVLQNLSDHDQEHAMYRRAFQNSLRLLQSMVGEDAYSSRAAGRFVLLSKPAARDAEPRRDVEVLREQLTNGTVEFLQRQMYENISAQIDRAVESGQAGYLAAHRQAVPGSSQLLSNVRVYVDLLQSSGKLPAQSARHVDDTIPDRRLPLWPCVYICLRCGGFEDALALLQRCLSSGSMVVDEAAVGFLEHLCELLRLSQAPVHTSQQQQEEALQNLYESILRCRELYASLDHQSSGEEDPFYMCVLNLFGLYNPRASFPEVLRTVEDVTWMSLWFVRICHLLPNSRQTTEILQRLDGRMSVNDVYRWFKEAGGAQRFDPGNRNPFKYAHILLTVQRYADAVAYLVRTGQEDAAAHLSTVLLFYGLLSPVAVLPSSENDFVEQQHSVLSPLSGSTVARFMRSYVSRFQISDPEVAVDYLVALMNGFQTGDVSPEVRAEFHECLADLIASTALRSSSAILFGLEAETVDPKEDPLLRIVGNTDKSGGSAGWLEQYLSRDHVRMLTRHAATRLTQEEGETVAAAFLFSVVAAHVDLIALVNDRLSAALSGVGHESVARWQAIATIHLHANGETTIENELAAANHHDFYVTFVILYNICNFVDLVEKGEWVKAVDLIYELDLLPAKVSSVEAKLQQAQGVDRCLQAAMDTVVSRTMESLYQMYTAFKKNTPLPQLQQSEALKEIRTRTEALVAFVNAGASTVSTWLSEETRRQLARYDSMMMYHA